MEKGKIISIEDRIPKLKQQRRKKANRRLIFLLLLFFLLIICIIYFQSPLSQVKSIAIKGNIIYSEEELKKTSGINQTTNIWTINKEKVEQLIKKESGIKTAKVSIILPNKVNIDVEEYKKIVYISDGNKYIPVISNGEILNDKSFESVPYDAPLIIDLKKENILKKVVEELEKLPSEVYNAISEVHYTPKKTDSFHINVFMNDGFEVAASLNSFSDKMKHYPSIISQLNPNKKGIIDLEVGSYFKAYDSEGEEDSEK